MSFSKMLIKRRHIDFARTQSSICL